MKVRWLKAALNDLQTLHKYISDENPAAAARVAKQILHAVELLKANPAIGRPGRVYETREWIVSDTAYIIPYRVTSRSIEILRVYHSAMEWPKEFLPH